MRKRWLNVTALLTIVGLLFGPVVSFAAAAPGDEPVRQTSGRPEPREVPEEIQALFEGGMSAEEFVQMAGYVPHALEEFVGDTAAMMVIQLEQPSLAEKVIQQRETGYGTMSAASMNAYVNKLTLEQEQIKDRLAKLSADTVVVSQYTAAYNGLMALVPLSKLNQIRAMENVKSVHRAPEHEPALGTSVDLIGAYDVWADTGYTGNGVTIAVIDTGIDYTHAALGGSGNPTDFSTNNPDMIEAGTFPTAKVVGGYDFAGTDYDAGGSGAETIPQPDLDPLDEYGHGTHVASIAAGVSAGSVMTGVAPGASLVALKVFGESGSTNLTMDAIDWVTTNYLYHGEPQVINMSLGSRYGTGNPNEPDVEASNTAAEVGVVVVASAGNEGDVHYITGSPGTADSVISVAASTTGVATGPTVSISGTTYMTQTNLFYQPSAFDSGGHFTQTITETLYYVGNLYANTGMTDTLCTTQAISQTTELMGKIALIQRGDCAFSTKANNAASLGAIAALIFNHATGGDAPITMIGDPVAIPAASLGHTNGMNLAPASGETAIVSAEDVVTTQPVDIPSNSIANFSSRGPRGFDSMLKPDVTAPGVAIFAADMGSGNKGVSMNGTSMAAPHVAGLAALMVEAAAGRSEAVSIPQMTKAAMMNTATDLMSGMQVPRQGAGRVNAVEAVSAVDAGGGVNTLAFADPDLVTANWGVVPTSHNQKVITQAITVWSDYPGTLTYTVSADLAVNAMISDTKMTITDTTMITKAVMVDIAPSQVVLDASGGAVDHTVVLTLTVDATMFPVDFNWLEEVYGFVEMTPTDPMANEMRVPFYALPRPYTKFTDIESNTSMADPAIGKVTATLTQTGPISSSLWAYPALVYDADEPMQMNHGDVRMVGMSYPNPFIGTLDVAINTYDAWHTPQSYVSEFDLYLDVNEDGVDDFVDFNFNYGYVFGSGNDDDMWIVVQVDLSSGTVGLASSWLIYTDYNANVMEWWLSPAAHGLDGTSNPHFDYQLIGFDYWGNVDTTMPGRFHIGAPPLMGMWSNVPGPNNRQMMASSYIYNLPSYLYSQPVGTMLVDYNGDPRDGGQAIFFAGPVAASIYLPVVLR
jgi:subtilisin family serine protease